MRICVIFNPTARGNKAARFRRRLAEIGAECALEESIAAGDARKRAAEAVRAGFEIIAAAGGDGTINEVINGIGDVPHGFEQACLGVLPLGTVNVFARELGISSRIEPAWKTLCAGRETRIDLPRVEFAGNTGTCSRYFAQLAGAGLDARAVQLVHWPLKKRIGPLAYIVAGFQALLHSQARITVTDGQQTATGELVLIGNGRLYGGQFTVFPGADLRDGLLEVCVFPRINWFTLVRCGPSLLLRGTLPPRTTQNFRAASLTLSGVPAAPVEIDGEFVGHLPATVSLERSRLRVMAP